jgi:hypothetical protein
MGGVRRFGCRSARRAHRSLQDLVVRPGVGTQYRQLRRISQFRAGRRTHQKPWRRVSCGHEAVGRSARNENKVTGDRLNLDVTDVYGRCAVQDVERLLSLVVHVKRRRRPRVGNFDGHIVPSRVIACGLECVRAAQNRDLPSPRRRTTVPGPNDMRSLPALSRVGVMPTITCDFQVGLAKAGQSAMLTRRVWSSW